MPSNGVLRTVVSAQTMKNATESTVMKAMTNANEEAKKSDPKDKTVRKGSKKN